MINILGTIKWTQNNFMRSQLENTIKNAAGDFYLQPNEYMYINMLFDNISAEHLDGMYYEMYKVIPLETIDALDISHQDSTLLVLLSDDTYLYPSGGKYKINYLIGDGDTTFKTTENYEKLSIGDNNPFKTRQPMYLRMGISRRWEGQAIVAADLVTGFSNLYGSRSAWRASMGVEIIRFKGNWKISIKT